VTRETDVKGENVVRQTLARLHSIDGLISAALVEPDSAHVLETRTGDRVAATVAAGASDVIQVIGLMTASLGDPDELEDVIITLGRRHHLITPLPTAGADGLILVVTLDRSATNLALARRQLRALGPLLEIATTVGHAQ
jgi:predicted regulator of Ras-like GTPase activity (Roadblock/LC7/MglB family)